MINFSIIFLTLSMSIGANLSDGFLTRMGIDANILIAALIAFVVTGLIAQRKLALIIMVVLLTLGANVPDTTAASMGFDPDYLLVALITLVLAPLGGKLLS